jgi:hypothetical protein
MPKTIVARKLIEGEKEPTTTIKYAAKKLTNKTLKPQGTLKYYF